MPDWEELFKKIYQSKEAADIAAASVKKINVLGEAGVPGFKGLMEFIDQSAYNIASQSAAPGRDMSEIKKRLEWEEGDVDDRSWWAHNMKTFTGIFDDDAERFAREGQSFMPRTQERPDLLKIFLGMEENVLPESEYKPTSWTKGDPEQGWRSIKDFSELEVKLPAEEASRYGEVTFPTHQQHQKINLMRKAVASGEYTPEMAVKEKNFPGLRYDTSVNLGHMTKSVGYDPEKEQYYFSMSDVWDFEPEQYAEIWADPSSPESKKEMYAQSALMQAAGKPVGLYDRYYLPENYMTDWFGELDIEDKIVAGMKKMDGFWVNEGVIGE